MNDEVFKLLVKKLSGELTPQEQEKIDALLKSDKKILSEFEELQKTWNLFDNRDLGSDYKEAYGVFLNKVAENEVNKTYKKVYSWVRYAAVVVLWLGILIFAMVLKKDIKIYNTSQVTKTVRLDDGSKVILKPGAYIIYKVSLLGGFNREINFDGEAEFFVKKSTKPFVVHTGNFDVKVLGTNFLVSTRKKVQFVLLKSGKVQILAIKSSESDTASLLPGEIFEYDTGSGFYDKHKLNENILHFSGDEKLIFNNYTISDINEIFRIYFGKEIVLPDSSLWQKRVQGTAPADDYMKIAEALAFILHKNFEERKDTIFIK